MLLRRLARLRNYATTNVRSITNASVFTRHFNTIPRLMIYNNKRITTTIIRLTGLLNLAILTVSSHRRCTRRLQLTKTSGILYLPFSGTLTRMPSNTRACFIIIAQTRTFSISYLGIVLGGPTTCINVVNDHKHTTLIHHRLLRTNVSTREIRTLCTPVKLSVNSRATRRVTLSVLTRVMSVGGTQPRARNFSSTLLRTVTRASTTKRRTILTIVTTQRNSAPQRVNTGVLIHASNSVINDINNNVVRRHAVLTTRRVLAKTTPTCRQLRFSTSNGGSSTTVTTYNKSVRVMLAQLRPKRRVG